MTPVESFRDHNIAVFGLGGSGLSTIRALREGGAHIAAWMTQKNRVTLR